MMITSPLETQPLVAQVNGAPRPITLQHPVDQLSSEHDALLPNSHITPYNCSMSCAPTMTQSAVYEAEVHAAGAQTLGWGLRPNDESSAEFVHRISNTRPTAAARPLSYPPKPTQPNMFLDLHNSIANPHMAPLATPEAVSESSSMTSVNSRGSWLSGQYVRLPSEVNVLAPILQSPVRMRALHNYDAFRVSPSMVTSPGKWSPLKRPFNQRVAADASPMKRVEFSEAKQPAAPNGSVTSLDSPQQCVYDGVNGCYSPHARGYPHGHAYSVSLAHAADEEPVVPHAASQTTQGVTNSEEGLCKSHSQSQQNGLGALAQHMPRKLCVPVIVTSHEDSVFREVVSCSCGDASSWSDALRSKNHSSDLFDDELASRSDVSSDADDVSCTDSEPFMTQVVDLESPSTSPLCHVKQSSLFVQESHV